MSLEKTDLFFLTGVHITAVYDIYICMRVCMSMVLEILGPRNTFWSSYPFSILNSEGNRCSTEQLYHQADTHFSNALLIACSWSFCKTGLLNNKQTQNTALKQHQESLQYPTPHKPPQGRRADRWSHQNVVTISGQIKIFSN